MEELIHLDIYKLIKNAFVGLPLRSQIHPP